MFYMKVQDFHVLLFLYSPKESSFPANLYWNEIISYEFNYVDSIWVQHFSTY